MADFVAVIRRTIDGLSENTPAMRERVYAKARMAVRRQLENMSPRPSEAAIDAQLAKLEGAIGDVEADFIEPDLSSLDLSPEPEPFEPPAAEAEPQPQPAADLAPEPEDDPADHFDPIAQRRIEEERAAAEAAEREAQSRQVDSWDAAPVHHEASHGEVDDTAHNDTENEQDQGYTSAPPETDASARDLDSEEPAAWHGGPVEDTPYQDEATYDVPPEADGSFDDRAGISPIAEDLPQTTIVQTPEPARPAGVTPVPFGSYALGRSANFVRQQRDEGGERSPSGGFMPSRYQTGFPRPDIAPDPDFAADSTPYPAEEPLPEAEAVQATHLTLADDAYDSDAGPAEELPEPEHVEPVLVESTVDDMNAGIEPEPPAAVDAMPGSDMLDFDDEPVSPAAGVAAAPVNDDLLFEAPARRIPTQDDAALRTDGEDGAFAARGMERFEDEIESAHQQREGHDEWSFDADDADSRDLRDNAHVSDIESDAERPLAYEIETPAGSGTAVHPGLVVAPSALAGASRGEYREEPEAVEPDHDALFGFERERRPDETVGRGPVAAEPMRRKSVRATASASSSGKRKGLIALAVLLLLAGAGTAAWMNRDSVGDLVAGAPPGAATEEATPAADAPAVVADTDADDPAADDAGGAGEQEIAALPSEPAAQSDGLQKFTQRLLPNGTEVDEGPAPVAEQPQPGEGRSLAMQSEADGAADPAPVGEGGTVLTEEEVALAAPDVSEAENGAAAPEALGVSETMVLYEERLGQTGPTAVQGNVAWRLVSETPGADQPAEAAIQADISVPEREFSATMMIKRNADSSLPASHIVEIIFDLPADFDGGGIEAIQRIAFKQTEEDRGNELIAVPAKITDEFFMVALNDYAEAVATNTELMRSRSWIDIPVIYDNGRRALITLDKGSAGAEVFTRALADWQRRSGTAANQ
jgi:hypothetical protein